LSEEKTSMRYKYVHKPPTHMHMELRIIGTTLSHAAIYKTHTPTAHVQWG